MANVLFSQTALTIEQCEELFKKNNLRLIAEQYNIEIAKAAVIQAKIWEQPYISGELNAINPAANRYFDIGNTGQKTLAIQQLIYLGGKKKNEIELAKSDVALAELQFQQVLLSLRYHIKQNFYGIYYDLEKIKTTSIQLANIDSLLNNYSTQAQKGNIPLKDVVRLQSFAISIKSALIELQKNVYLEQENLKLLTASSTDIQPIVTDATLEKNYNKTSSYSIEELKNIALEKNPEYLTYKKISENDELVLQWQKSLAIPDVTLGASYDQNGGAFQNQVNLTLGMPLPLWNRNKGNIKMAEAQLLQNKATLEQKMQELKAKVETAYNMYIYQQNQYTQLNAGTQQNLETVYKGVLQNFQKRNISLIEFTDFMESYNHSILLLNEMKKQLIISAEELNLLVNEQVF